MRIFLGTEPAQHRAERVFVWSIERVRDPGRRYEIHLMKDLAGFDRRRWTTGFTNYRFAIPHLAGGRGRAIYNDVDQVYRTDPAALFDLDLGDHGVLQIAPDDPSVMLLDAGRMARVWTLEDAQRLPKAELIRRARERPGLVGALDPAWNTRDDERPPDAAKLIHFTTLHTQPWRPFPERFVYQPNPVGDAWHALEAEADAAGFEVFTRERPSARYPAWRTAALPRVEGAADAYRPPLPGAPPTPTAPALRAGPWLAELSEDDLPWVLADLFAAARERVRVDLPWSGLRRDADAWQDRLRHAARSHPGLHWELRLAAAGGREEVRSGGAWRGPTPPRVWVLCDDRPGNATQAQGLAEELGWPYEVKRLACRAASMLHNRLLGASVLGVDPARSSPLEPPWPDLVIAAGRRTAPVAQWIRRRGGGRPRLVVLGRKGGDDADLFDLVVTPSYTRLFPHPRRLETDAPLHRVTADALAKAADEWSDRLGDAPFPRIAVLVGGTSGQYRLSPDTARRLARETSRLARESGGSLLVTTSRRLGASATEAFCAAAADVAFLHRWSPGDDANPYLGLLAHADAFVITGDSESMLAEATSLGKPVAIFPLPVRTSFRVLSVLREWVWRRATATPLGPRGTPRPQRGLERLCGRLVERGFVRPSRDLDRLHRALFARGAARPFGEPLLLAGAGARLDDRARVARRVRALLGVREPGADGTGSPDAC